MDRPLWIRSTKAEIFTIPCRTEDNSVLGEKHLRMNITVFFMHYFVLELVSKIVLLIGDRG